MNVKTSYFAYFDTYSPKINIFNKKLPKDLLIAANKTSLKQT